MRPAAARLRSRSKEMETFSRGRSTRGAKWPAALSALKFLARDGDRGAGDIIARIIGPIGGCAFKKWYKELFGRDCECGKRQEILNMRWPL